MSKTSFRKAKVEPEISQRLFTTFYENSIKETFVLSALTLSRRKLTQEVMDSFLLKAMNAWQRFDVAENIDEFLSIDDGGWDFIMGHLNETPTVDEMYSVLDQLERATFCQHNGRFFVVMMIF